MDGRTGANKDGKELKVTLSNKRHESCEAL